MLREGDVIDAVCRCLEARGYRIDQRLSTEETGIDIIASRGSNRILVEAKGATSSRESSSRYGKRFSSSQRKDHVAKELLALAQLRRRPLSWGQPQAGSLEHQLDSPEEGPSRLLSLWWRRLKLLLCWIDMGLLSPAGIDR